MTKEGDEVAQPLGGFGQVAAPVSGESREIILYQVLIHLVDGITLSLQPLSKLLSGAKKALYTT